MRLVYASIDKMGALGTLPNGSNGASTFTLSGLSQGHACERNNAREPAVVAS